MSYKIIATRIDTDGMLIASNNAETLGDACGREYDTEAEAQAVCDELTASRDEYGMADAEYEVVEA